MTMFDVMQASLVRCILVIALLTGIAYPLEAEELSLLGGIMRDTATNNSSYSWQIEYLERLNRHLSLSATYLNEGHIPDHHRDGYSLMLWARTDSINQRLSLGAGVGPYFYYDTNAAKADGSYNNNHGWGTILSLAATWHSGSHWLYQLRANTVKTFDNIDTFSALAGIGYSFEGRTQSVASDQFSQDKHNNKNELTLFLGQAILNNFDSHKTEVVSIEYRRSFMRHIDGTIAWFYQNNDRLLRNNKFSTQLWGVKAFLDERLTLGIGAGAYISINRSDGSETSNIPHSEAVSGILSLSASYQIHPEWVLRTSWNRITTSNDRDSDIILGGIGYRF